MKKNIGDVSIYTDKYNHLMICKKSVPIFISSMNAIKIVDDKIHWTDLDERKRLVNFMSKYYSFEFELIKKYI